MLRRDFSKMLGLVAAGPFLTPGGALAREPRRDAPRRWELRADIAECCSCDIPCSCNFGRPESVCHGTRLIRLREGQIEGADLAGINFVVTFFMGRWTRIYMDDSMSSTQLATLEQLLPVAFAGFNGGARVKERAPLLIEEGTDTFRFSVPESTVEMRLMPGLDGVPIRITGLPNPAYHDYVQYESVVHEHSGPDLQWSHSGTNGFRSVMRVSG
jgi:hypothetical protein